MEHSYMALYDNVMLRPLSIEDIEKLRVWRNDENNSKFLRNIGYITSEMQLKWFNNYLNDSNEIIFAIEEVSELKRVVGSVSLYNFKYNEAEIGKILIGDEEASGRGIGRKSFVMAMKVGFSKLGLKKIVASVHQDNVKAHSNYMKIGFIITGKHPYEMGGYEDEIMIDEKRMREVNSYVDQIIIKN